MNTLNNLLDEIQQLGPQHNPQPLENVNNLHTIEIHNAQKSATVQPSNDKNINTD